MKGFRIPLVILLAVAIFVSVILSSTHIRAARVLKSGIIGATRLSSGSNSEIKGKYDSSMAVKCENGIFVGKNEKHLKSWKGIPYAKPPVGNLRWKIPLKQEKSSRVFEAFCYPKASIQPYVSPKFVSEDCLYLNVFSGTKDSKSAEKKPVIVWIHGGEYSLGSSTTPFFMPDEFARAHPDVLVVTIQYRLGIMGFANFSIIEGGENYRTAGNLGLLDQKCALEWISRNIQGFGGDPGNVTLVGDSEGAGSISLLALVQGSENLFHKAILQSGSFAMSYNPVNRLASTELMMDQFDARTMEDLLSVPESKLVKAAALVYDSCNAAPSLDGFILPENPEKAYADGKASSVKMIIGTNAQEARHAYFSFMFEKQYNAWIKRNAESALKLLEEHERPRIRHYLDSQTGDENERCEKFLTKVAYTEECLVQADLQSRYNDVYVYINSFAPFGRKFGAYRGSLLPLLFGQEKTMKHSGFKTENFSAVSETIQEMWVNFAKTGCPDTESVKWGKYTEENPVTMNFSSGGTFEMEHSFGRDFKEVLRPAVKVSYDVAMSID